MQELGNRHTWHGATVLYKATVAPEKILAYLERRGEGWTVVVDPGGLTEIVPCEDVYGPQTSPTT